MNLVRNVWINKKNLYRIHIKVCWCIDSSLQKIFWKFIQHTHSQTPAHFRTLPHTPMHNHAYRTHPHTPAPTHVHVCTLVHTCTHPCTPAHTHAQPHTPAHTPHIPADALNLINRMKLHVYTVIYKGGRKMREREKKEGTKVRWVISRQK